jgi:hypothetical protein
MDVTPGRIDVNSQELMNPYENCINSFGCVEVGYTTVIADQSGRQKETAMTRRIAALLTILAAVWFIGFVTAQSEVPQRNPVKMSFYREATGTNLHISEINRDVTEFADGYESAMKKKDSTAILKEMAENWAYSNERGESYPREQWVAERVDPNKGKNLIFPFFQHVDIAWHVFGDNTIVETGRSNSTLYYKGRVSHGPRRETAVYTKINGKWVQASLHVGFIPDEQRDFTFPAGALPHGVTQPDPRSDGPKHQDLQMAQYHETTGIDEGVLDIKANLLKFVDEYGAAMTKKDSITILGDMGEFWAYSNERGETYSKEQWVAERVDSNRDKNLIFPFAEHVDVMWHVFGDSTVVETGRSNSTLYYKGKVSHGPRRETAVYAKVNGKWVQASIHVGFIPAEQKDFTFPDGALPK